MATSAQPGSSRRAAIIATIPRGYSPVFHLLFPSALGLGVLVTSIALLDDLRPGELLTIPITLVAGLGFEWRAHKDMLHRRLPLLGELYRRHELQHHVIYTYDDMELKSPRELRLILMPAYAIVLVFAGVLPLAFGVGALTTRNIALLFAATSMIFFLSYEWLHMAYHLPEQSPAYRLPLIRRLRELHRRHHDPRLMKRWNFNVTIPLFDLIHGTLWSPEREARRDARSRRGSLGHRS